MYTDKPSRRRSLDVFKNTSNDLLKSQIKISENEPKNSSLQKFNEIYCDYERGKIDAKTLKGKLKIELGIKAKENQYLNELLKNENLDKKNFSRVLRESQIISDERRNTMPDFSPILEKSSLNMNYHKRFRHQQTILFQDRQETFNYKESNKNNNAKLKESVNKYLNGSLREEELKSVLKQNNIDPNLNSIKRELKSASVSGLNNNKNLLNCILKNQNQDEQKDFCHSTVIDFTVNREYSDPLAKITKRLFVNNPSLVSDKGSFYWFDDTKKDGKTNGDQRNNSVSYIDRGRSQNNSSKQNNNNNVNWIHQVVRPSDPVLNKTNKKLLMHSNRNNIESHSIFNDISKRSASTAFSSM